VAAAGTRPRRTRRPRGGLRGGRAPPIAPAPPSGELSGGQRQRVLVAPRAPVAASPGPAFLLDEPFSGVDRPAAPTLLGRSDRSPRSRGSAGVIRGHARRPSKARRWDLVLCLTRRQVAFGPPEPTLTVPGARGDLRRRDRRPAPRAPAAGARAVLPAHHHCPRPEGRARERSGRAR